MSIMKKVSTMTSDQYRILTPSEWEAFRDAIPKARLRAVMDGLLFTGMRYTEFARFADSLKWFDPKNRAIVLPATATKTGKERTVQLTPASTKSLSQYLREYKTLEVPHITVMNHNMKRWWYLCFEGNYENMDRTLNMEWYPTPKTLRKTWESWLLFVKQEDGRPKYDSLMIADSQGHSQTIQLNHYMNMSARLKSEAEAVRRLTEGWGT
ncbi:MAG: site-specific integrase [Candidatus Methanoperedens sp.]